MKRSPPLPRPSAQLVAACVERFDANQRYAVAERALHLLLKEFPSNFKLEHVLLKVVALNRLYSTNIFDVIGFANHLTRLNPDFGRARVDDDLVDQIARRTDRPRREYSFATKYCSWHSPDAFVIYDSRVDELLCDYQDEFGFGEFRPQELKHYPALKKALEDFRRHFGLDDFSFKQVDKFLWIHCEELKLTNPRVQASVRRQGN